MSTNLLDKINQLLNSLFRTSNSTYNLRACSFSIVHSALFYLLKNAKNIIYHYETYSDAEKQRILQFKNDL